MKWFYSLDGFVEKKLKIKMMGFFVWFQWVIKIIKI
jgi:hypothetical protein